MKDTWKVLCPHCDGDVVERVLAARGITAGEARERFLWPSFEAHLHDPYLLPDMARGVERIHRAIRNNETIVVFGDYDADGVTATVLLLDVLRALGGRALPVLPHRIIDGYGISKQGVRRAQEAGANLIITVDNGISAAEALAFANEQGLSVVVTDHHLQGEQPLPLAEAVIDPNRNDSIYPFPGIAGVGVAYKLAEALTSGALEPAERERLLKWSLDLVAMGTVADVAPLIDENRVLVHFGLKVIAKARRPGIRALLDISGSSDQQVAPETVGFRLGPRINAAGRLEAADAALELLLSKDMTQARQLAQRLDAVNKRRQALVQEAVKESLDTVDPDDRFIVLAGSWHPGIIGLIAAKAAERFYRPALVLTDYENAEMLKGSARSPATYHIAEAFDRVTHLLHGHGGHARAAGLSVSRAAVASLTEALKEDAAARLSDQDLQPFYEIDTWLHPEEATIHNAERLKELGPFGEGNPNPLFVSRGAVVQQARSVGNGSHLSMQLDLAGTRMSAIGFGLGEHAESMTQGRRIDVVFHLEINDWRGTRSPQMVVEDLSLSS